MYFNLVHVFGLDPGILPDDAGNTGNNDTNASPAETRFYYFKITLIVCNY